MNTQVLLNLIEISQHKSMSKAAQTLHLSPQALSISIKKLEEELGFKLLNTSFNGSILTEDAQKLIEIAQDFFKSIDNLKQTACSDNKSTPEAIDFIAAPGIITAYIDKIYSYMRQKQIHYHINFQSYSTKEILQKIQQQQIPYAFIYDTLIDNVSSIQAPDVILLPIRQDPIFILTGKEHPLTKYKSISLKTAFHYPIILVENSNYMLQNVFSLYGTPEKIINCPSQTVISTLLENSNGFTLSYANNHIFFSKDLVKIKLKDHMISNFCIAYNTNNANFPYEYLQFLIDFFQNNS